MFELTTNMIFKDALQDKAEGKKIKALLQESAPVGPMSNNVDEYNAFTERVKALPIEKIKEIYGEFELLESYAFRKEIAVRFHRIPKDKWPEWSKGFLADKKQIVDSTVFEDGDEVVASFSYWGGL